MNWNVASSKRRCRYESIQLNRLFPPPKDLQGNTKHNKGRGECSRLTQLGRVSLSRTRYYDKAGGSDVPVDKLIDEVGRLITLGVSEVACRLAIDSASFQRAAENLLRAAGLSISEESLRKLVEHEGKLLLEAQRSEQLELDFAASDCQTTVTPDQQPVTRIYMGSDGTMVPVITDAEKLKRREKARENRKNLPRLEGCPRRRLPAVKRGADGPYKEFKIVTIYDQDQKHRYVRATRGDCKAAGKLMRRGAAELRVKAAQEKLVVADGAPWIWNQAELNVPCMQVKVLDFYHLSEHVHEVKRVLFGEENESGETWVSQVLHAVRHEGYDPFWSTLVETRAGVRSPAKRSALDGLMQYVSQRSEMIIYPRCDEMGWDVGSGSTESMCNTMTRRLKMRGMRWDPDNAEAMMALETLQQCNAWDAWRKMRRSSMN
jgi:hypothetical protein